MDLTTRIELAVEALASVFRDGRPAFVGWSSGKDSSAALNLTLQAARRVTAETGACPPMVVTYGDTGVEPHVAAHADSEAAKIRAYAEAEGLDVRVEVARPSLNDSWAVKVLGGRSLPPLPSRSRQCTVDWKIRPQQRVRNQAWKTLKAEGYAAPVIVLGTRATESAGRAARMAERGEDHLAPWTGEDGELYLSPVATWDEDAIWEYLGLVGQGAYAGYSDFRATLAFYANGGGTSCGVVAEQKLQASQAGSPCGARFGCVLCSAIDKDDSIENMMASDPESYGHLDGLHRLRKYILATQSDLTRRQWLPRTLPEDGWLPIQPDLYSPAMLAELLRMVLTIDAVEAERARAKGLDGPRFRIVGPRELIAIDALWSLQAYHWPFEALAIWHEVYREGKRYPVPEVEPVNFSRREPIPEVRYYPVSVDDTRNLPGLADTAIQTVNEPGWGGCRDHKMHNDGRLVLDVDEGPQFNVDLEAGLLVFELELDKLLAERHELMDWTEGYRYWVRMGVVELAKGQSSAADKILRRSGMRTRLGLAGPQGNAASLWPHGFSADSFRANRKASDDSAPLDVTESPDSPKAEAMESQIEEGAKGAEQLCLVL